MLIFPNLRRYGYYAQSWNVYFAPMYAESDATRPSMNKVVLFNAPIGPTSLYALDLCPSGRLRGYYILPLSVSPRSHFSVSNMQEQGRMGQATRYYIQLRLLIIVFLVNSLVFKPVTRE